MMSYHTEKKNNEKPKQTVKKTVTQVIKYKYLNDRI